MPRKKRTTEPKTAKRNQRGKHTPVAVDNGHPSQVAESFKDDPTFEEFREILQRQRHEDYRQAGAGIDAAVPEQQESQPCTSSIRTRSRTTKPRTRS